MRGQLIEEALQELQAAGDKLLSTVCEELGLIRLMKWLNDRLERKEEG